MNRLPDAKRRALLDLLNAGATTRQAARAVRCAIGTAKRYRKIVYAVLKRQRPRALPRCGCARHAGHRGWCAYRVKRSPQRQALLARWHTSGLVRTGTRR